jgi:hypothetical protein
MHDYVVANYRRGAIAVYAAAAVLGVVSVLDNKSGYYRVGVLSARDSQNTAHGATIDNSLLNMAVISVQNESRGQRNLMAPQVDILGVSALFNQHRISVRGGIHTGLNRGIIIGHIDY